MLRFSGTEFGEIVRQGARSLVGLGFEIQPGSDAEIVARSACTRVRFLQDRGGEIYAKISRVGETDEYSLQEVATFVGCEETLPRQAQDSESAVQLISRLSVTLGSDAYELAMGSEPAWAALSERIEISRVLETQRYTKERRDPGQWNLLVAAWNERRYESVVRLIGLFPRPATQVELQAAAFAKRKLDMETEDPEETRRAEQLVQERTPYPFIRPLAAILLGLAILYYVQDQIRSP